jgi:hypothetical protein
MMPSLAGSLLFRIPNSTSWMDISLIDKAPKEISIPFSSAKVFTPDESRIKDTVKIKMYPNTVIEIKDARGSERFGKIRYDLALKKYAVGGAVY